jgi:RecA-family ATPase
MAAIFSRGRAWPTTIVDGVDIVGGPCDPASVVLVGIEDDDADTVVPRLIAAGADLNQIHAMMQQVDAKGYAVPFTIPDDIDRLREAVVETAARFVVIDPIAACMPEWVRPGSDRAIAGC